MLPLRYAATYTYTLLYFTMYKAPFKPFVGQACPTKWRKNCWRIYMKKLRHCHPMWRRSVAVTSLGVSTKLLYVGPG